MAAENSGTLAVLIDGDNASPKIVVGLMAEIANYGTASFISVPHGMTLQPEDTTVVPKKAVAIKPHSRNCTL
ncbi:hypothetical protein JOH51_004394 [Rhizobium leguminosarum]|nr:hypothetical protein [Rhizobium leguminosarum]MBP2446955.1 hypothetical protein [Rhizobium leguminosarum]